MTSTETETQPKKKKLPYILFAAAMIGYFIIIVSSPFTFDWWSFLLWMVFMGGIAAILGGARPPGWRKDAQGRNR